MVSLRYARRLRIKSSTILLLLAYSLTATAVTHHADTDKNRQISLSELLRGIQFYNLGRIGCHGASEDGYDPYSDDRSCVPHHSDYSPQDWRIELGELLRLIQFFNGGGYRCCVAVEDGFLPDARGGTEQLLADDHGNAPADATWTALGAQYAGCLEWIGDIDVFVFPVVAGQVVIAEVSGSAPRKLALLGSGQDPIVVPEVGGGLAGPTSRIAHRASKTGNYYLSVSAIGGSGDPGCYSLALGLDNGAFDDDSDATLVLDPDQPLLLDIVDLDGYRTRIAAERGPDGTPLRLLQVEISGADGYLTRLEFDGTGAPTGALGSDGTLMMLAWDGDTLAGLEFSLPGGESFFLPADLDEKDHWGRSGSTIEEFERSTFDNKTLTAKVDMQVLCEDAGNRPLASGLDVSLQGFAWSASGVPGNREFVVTGAALKNLGNGRYRAEFGLGASPMAFEEAQLIVDGCVTVVSNRIFKSACNLLVKPVPPAACGAAGLFAPACIKILAALRTLCGKSLEGLCHGADSLLELARYDQLSLTPVIRIPCDDGRNYLGQPVEINASQPVASIDVRVPCTLLEITGPEELLLSGAHPQATLRIRNAGGARMRWYARPDSGRLIISPANWSASGNDLRLPRNAALDLTVSAPDVSTAATGTLTITNDCEAGPEGWDVRTVPYRIQTVSQLPDLIADAPRVFSQSVREGEPFWLACVVRNVGNATAPQGLAQLRLIPEAGSQAAAVNIGDQPIPALAPGQSADLRWDFTMPGFDGPAPLSVGTLVQIDPQAVIEEINEGNNFAVGPSLTVSGGIIDLYLLPSFVLLRANEPEREVVLLSRTQAAAMQWRVANAPELPGWLAVSPLQHAGPGARAAKVRLSDFASLPSPAPGNDRVSVSVWFQNALSGALPRDRVALTVEISMELPDLVALPHSAQMYASRVTEGNYFSFSVRVRNSGQASAPASQAEFFVARSADGLSGRVQMGRVSVPALPPGEERVLLLEVNPFPSLGSGEYTLYPGIEMDVPTGATTPGGTVIEQAAGEGRTSNTFMFGQTFVVEDPPDDPIDGRKLTLTRRVLGDGYYEPGERLGFEISIASDALTPRELRALALVETPLPPGWSYDGLGSGTAPVITPVLGKLERLDFTWDVAALPPVFPVLFSYYLRVPADATGPQTIHGRVQFGLDVGGTAETGSESTTVMPRPQPEGEGTPDGEGEGTPEGEPPLLDLRGSFRKVGPVNADAAIHFDGRGNYLLCDWGTGQPGDYTGTYTETTLQLLGYTITIDRSGNQFSLVLNGVGLGIYEKAATWAQATQSSTRACRSPD